MVAQPEPISIGIAATALLVAGWAAWRQMALQARVVAIEEARDHAVRVASRKAQVRAAFERDGGAPALVLVNDGAAAAERIEIRARTPGEDPEGWARAAFYRVQPVARLAPRARVAQRVVEADGSPTRYHVALEWTNADGTRDRWASELTIPAAAPRPR